MTSYKWQLMHWKKNIKRVFKLETERKSIELVSNFNYLWYIISDDNDISIKLQRYNKLNGMIKGHFCKRTTTETKLQKYITLLL
jgi:adenine deaminase